MNAAEINRLSDSVQPVSLATWLGEPLSPRQAQICLACIRDSEQSAGSQKRHFNFRLAKLISRYWLGQDADMDYHNLAATVRSRHQRARLELCYGQLLLARKLRSAWLHLDAGFVEAAHLFAVEEYFIVLNRHERLRSLPLSSVPGTPLGLADLLSEAGVISQFEKPGVRLRNRESQHQDTLD